MRKSRSQDKREFMESLNELYRSEEQIQRSLQLGLWIYVIVLGLGIFFCYR